MIAPNLRKVQYLITQKWFASFLLAHHNHKTNLIRRIFLQNIHCLTRHKSIVRVLRVRYELDQLALFRLNQRWEFMGLVYSETVLCGIMGTS